MDEFYSTCITNMIEQSHDSHMTVSTAGLSQLPSFEVVSPLLSKMEDKMYALRVAKWLAKQLTEQEDKMKALSVALTMATQCREAATSEVFMYNVQWNLSIVATIGECRFVLHT